MSISKVDKNLAVNTAIDKQDVKYYDVRCGMFDILGLYEPYEAGCFKRMPVDFAKSISDNMDNLNRITTGGRIRFKTNSPYVVLQAHFPDPTLLLNSMTPLLGTSGFDLYVYENGTQQFYAPFKPPADFVDSYTQIVEFCDNSERDIVIYFPKYNNIDELSIGLAENSFIEKTKYKYTVPICFYGSSITQGGCSSRAGTTYEGYVSRYFDTDILNLGFSGNCKGEEALAEYIANLDMSIFVYDYDHNAPNVEHLENTHERFFKIFRKKHPDTPVIIMSKTDIPKDQKAKNTTENRKEVILKTYRNAVKSGDKNVYFIDGQEIFKLAGYRDCTVDGCHPNDLGFYCMGQAIIKVIEDNELLK